MNMQVFNSPDGLAIRTLEKNGEPWFVATDVCRALEIANPSQAVNGNSRDGGGLDEDERGICTADTTSGAQAMLCVNESGLYSLIFKSRKSVAKTFRKWVTSDVLPSIRKTGSYSTPQKVEQLNFFDELVKIDEPDLLEELGNSFLRKARVLRDLAEINASLAKHGIRSESVATTQAVKLAEPEIDYVSESEKLRIATEAKLIAWLEDRTIVTVDEAKEHLGHVVAGKSYWIESILRSKGFKRQRVGDMKTKTNRTYVFYR
jgi:prophage antirepressor-like protein